VEIGDAITPANLTLGRGNGHARTSSTSDDDGSTARRCRVRLCADTDQVWQVPTTVQPWRLGRVDVELRKVAAELSPRARPCLGRGDRVAAPRRRTPARGSKADVGRDADTL